MKLDMRTVLIALALVATLTAACVGDDRQRDSVDEITISNLIGLDPARAVRLVGNLDLTVHVERVDVSEMASVTPTSTTRSAGPFARGVVIDQDPRPGTRVAAGATLTLFVPVDRPLRAGEQTFQLLTHCGLSFPLEFEDQFWLPIDKQLRRTINPPQGFHSDGYYDAGTIRRVGENTIIYTSSTGREVEYEPTKQRPQGCE